MIGVIEKCSNITFKRWVSEQLKKNKKTRATSGLLICNNQVIHTRNNTETAKKYENFLENI